MSALFICMKHSYVIRTILAFIKINCTFNSVLITFREFKKTHSHATLCKIKFDNLTSALNRRNKNGFVIRTIKTNLKYRKTNNYYYMS